MTRSSNKASNRPVEPHGIRSLLLPLRSCPAGTNVVSPGFFDTFGLAPVSGRAITTADRSDALPIAVVSRRFAEKFFKDGDAIGRRIRLGGADSKAPWRTIVGVVPDVYSGDPEKPADERVSVAGMHCESGDVLIDDVLLPAPRRGDLLALPATGAYTLAMASNYNGVTRPAAVLVRDGVARLIRRRETVADLLRAEVGDGD